MPQTTVYDLSRLALRVTRAVPSGIDRLDLDWARHFVETENASAIVLGAMGSRLVPNVVARAIVDTLAGHWGEASASATDAEYERIRARLTGEPAPAAAGKPAPRTKTAATILDLVRKCPLGRAGLFPGRAPDEAVPQGAFYINVSQFPLALPRLARWLDRRPDLRAAIMVHDMLPVTNPEFFPPGEREQHLRFLARAARIAETLVVTGPGTATALEAHLDALPQSPDHRRPKVVTLPPDVNPLFATAPEIDEKLASTPFFVVLGTIEPRKNHLLLLNVWRELAAAHGPRTPTLVVIGALGWENENVLDLLERSPSLEPHVIRTHGLGTRGLKRLLDNCRSLLMPTFAEGFGLPVIEALAAGVPCIVSDIPPFSGLKGPIRRLDPLDGLGWAGAVEEAVAWIPDVQVRASQAVQAEMWQPRHGMGLINQLF